MRKRTYLPPYSATVVQNAATAEF